MNWEKYNNGTTVGTNGSEEGIIISDEEFNGARITLEKECRHIPFAITCGIDGWMVHTCYFSEHDKAEKQYKLIKGELEKIVNQIPNEGDLNKKEKIELVNKLIKNFIIKFP